jgi:hypothetical protein
MMCDKCEQQMVEVFNAQENRFKGWMCESCFDFAPAIGREHKFKIDDSGIQKSECAQ